MLQEKEIKEKLSIRKVLIPVLIGMMAAGYVLYNSITEVKFEKTEPGEGQYDLIDEGADFKNNDADFFYETDGGDYNRLTIRDSLRKVDWGVSSIMMLLGAILFVLFRVTGYIMRLRVLSDKQLSYRQSFNVVMLWEFASAITPSVVGGAGVAIFFLGREKISLGKSTAIVMITAMMDELFYVLIVPLTFMFTLRSDIFPNSWQQKIFGFNLTAEGVFWVGYTFIFVLIAILIYAVFINPRGFRYLLLKIFSFGFLKKYKYKVIQWGNDLVEASKEYKTKKLSFWLKAFGWTVFSWISRFIILNFLIMIVVPHIDQVYVFTKQIGMWIIMLISPTPGGAGLAEVACYHFFGGSVVPFTLVGIITVLWRLLTFFPYLIGGMLILPGWLRKTA